jgi:hypothetical protein
MKWNYLPVLMVLVLISLFCSAKVCGQVVGASLTATFDNSSATIVNEDPNFTVAFKYSTTWESQKVTAQGLQAGPLLTSYPQVVNVGPGKSVVVFPTRPIARDGASPSKVVGWNRLEVTWPYKATEQAAIDAKKRAEETRRDAEQKRQQNFVSGTHFQGFIEHLKRAGKKSGYYAGDSHYGAGYYSDTGQYLGSEDPERAAVNANRNPGFDQFGPAPSLNNFGSPPSLSNFDNRGDSSPTSPSIYAGMLPTLTPKGAPEWAWKDAPKTWTDKDGRVYLVEPLPAEYQNLTPEQLGVRRDDSLLDLEASERAMEEGFNALLKKYSRAGVWVGEAYDQAWNEKGVDFSIPSIGAEAARDIEELWESLQPKEGSFGSILRQVREREEAENEASIGQGYRNTSDGHLFFKRFVEAEAERIQKEAAALGFTVPDREAALKQGWQSIGGTYVSEERMQEWNAHAERFGITNPKLLYKIDEETPNAPRNANLEEGGTR